MAHGGASIVIPPVHRTPAAFQLAAPTNKSCSVLHGIATTRFLGRDIVALSSAEFKPEALGIHVKENSRKIHLLRLPEIESPVG